MSQNNEIAAMLETAWRAYCAAPTHRDCGRSKVDAAVMAALEAQKTDRIESALASAEPVAPWLDYAGNAIRSGDRIAHPDGTMGTVVFVHGFDHASEAWRVVYDGSSQLCRLILQVGEKGMASVVTSHAKPAAKVEARYECRECGSCGHAGINDASTTQSACFSCEWSGPEPGEDKCPGCGEEGCMTAACPECGARYRFVAELEAEPPGKTPASVPGGLTDQTLPDGCEPAGTRGIHPIR